MLSSNKDAKWYIVQVISNHEQKVKEALENRDFEDGDTDILEVYLPYTNYQTKSGNFKKRPMFPGYLYVKVLMTDNSWYIIRNTEFVTGIVGSSGQRTKPTPIPESQIEKIKNREKEELNKKSIVSKSSGVKDPILEVDFNIGDNVEIISGEFFGKIGRITFISIIKQIVNVEFEMFGRKTNIEIDINSVKKV